MGNSYYSGPKSDHFDGEAFFNPDGIPPKGLRDLLRWQLGKDRADWPDSIGVTQIRPDARVADLRVTMIGHASVLIQAGGVNILTDPVWSKRASPLKIAGPARVTAPGIAFDHLPPIDVVLLSHNHYDHMDISTLRRLHARYAMPVLTPLGNDTILRAAIPGIDARAGDWDDVLEGGGISTRLLQCHHWSARGTRDRSHALWCSFAVETPVGRIYAMGDTGYDGGRPYEVAARYGPYRLAIIPIGAYAPRWFMKGQHQNPDEAVAGFRVAGAKHALAHHWGTFQLTNEAREEPPEHLRIALAAAGISTDVFQTVVPGATWDVPA
ncbi:L-ascorbate metabolism protein UlaG, beta-lactamase superfamily [Jannaschia faecimaris]|uniref:L-ascorbate metabolism protein UlaG, beta-lactamase superfamily n=2 Tax=Jannaschia faecimaris TaxID=1244108 RepID=A0A1H3LMG2_9RHOB|nr:L-ascorbate metabolism protein UlaG, beta-lactamase superfamily [Jannaschia faecimaris]